MIISSEPVAGNKLLDLSAACDTVIILFFLNASHHGLAISGTALNWVKAYLKNSIYYLQMPSF
jgi:hypothetical protein